MIYFAGFEIQGELVGMARHFDRHYVDVRVTFLFGDFSGGIIKDIQIPRTPNMFFNAGDVVNIKGDIRVTENGNEFIGHTIEIIQHYGKINET